LNPEGTHGQRDIFFREFINLLNVEEPKPYIDEMLRDGCRVSREVRTDFIEKDRRRIDIGLHSGKFGIGIENKPSAEEGNDQVKEYLYHLGKKYKGNYLLVYLSGDGSKPKSISPEKMKQLSRNQKLVCMSYPNEAKKWLISCYKECKAEKIRWFLKDFIQFVETNFSLNVSDDEE
jgi:hypothetical protein